MRVPAAAGERPAERGFPDDPGLRHAARAPAPRRWPPSVATPLEKEFSTIAGIDSMTSSSTLGSTPITLQFDLSRDIDAAAQDVQAAISRAARQPAAGHAHPAVLRKVNPADQPILYLALTSPDAAAVRAGRVRARP